MLRLVSRGDIGLPAGLRAHVARSLQLALGRQWARIDRVVVRLSDVNADRGGEDKRCQVLIWLRAAPPVVVDERARDLRAAIDGALGRACQAVIRSAERKRARELRRARPLERDGRDRVGAGRSAVAGSGDEEGGPVGGAPPAGEVRADDGEVLEAWQPPSARPARAGGAAAGGHVGTRLDDGDLLG